jgi:hypothetical protein
MAVQDMNLKLLQKDTKASAMQESWCNQENCW